MKMSEDGRGQEYLDENVCLHELDYGSVGVEDWEVINSNEDVLVTISCRKCGERQQQTLCLQSMLEDLNLEWNE